MHLNNSEITLQVLFLLVAPIKRPFCYTCSLLMLQQTPFTSCKLYDDVKTRITFLWLQV